MAFETDSTINTLSLLSNLLIIMNSSSNFFVYMVRDKKFLACVASSVETSCGETYNLAGQNATIRRKEINLIY